MLNGILESKGNKQLQCASSSLELDSFSIKKLDKFCQMLKKWVNSCAFAFQILRSLQMITQTINREIWAAQGLPEEKADSWFAKQEANNWTMPDGKKIKKPEVMAKLAAEKLLERMSVSERKKYQVSADKKTTTVKESDQTKNSVSDEKLRELFRWKMKGAGWIMEDGNVVVDQESYLNYLILRFKLFQSKI